MTNGRGKFKSNSFFFHLLYFDHDGEQLFTIVTSGRGEGNTTVYYSLALKKWQVMT